MRYGIKLLLRTIWGFLTNVRHPRQWYRYHSQRAQHPSIFIVGCGHSGTSLLLSILGTHSHIYAVPGETAFAFDYSRNRPRLRQTDRLFLRYLDSKAIRAGKLRWVEKTPRHILAISFILKLRPDARIILIIRDGRDVAASLARRGLTVREGIDRWINDNRAAELFWNHPNVFKVRYEDLIADFKTTMLDVLSFLGEDYEDALSEYYTVPKFYYSKTIEKPSDEIGAHHETYRNWQINQPLFDGRGKWQSLSEGERDLIKNAAGKMLIDYGYVKDNQW